MYLLVLVIVVCHVLTLMLMLQEGGYLELKKPGTLSHCKEECETIAKVSITLQACGRLAWPVDCDACIVVRPTLG